MQEESFKEHVRKEIIRLSKEYKKIYLDYEYLICSAAFEKSDYYMIVAEADNYKHLTGINSKMDAKIFFEKCYNELLKETDFDFIKVGQNEKAVKGTVRRKIKVLPNMMNIFKSDIQVEENFTKNRIMCSFATADGNCTIGFAEGKKARPKSLIKGNELKNPKAVDLILRRVKENKKFDEIIVGDISILNQYKDKVGEIVSSELFE